MRLSIFLLQERNRKLRNNRLQGIGNKMTNVGFRVYFELTFLLFRKEPNFLSIESSDLLRGQSIIVNLVVL